ncbi:hypothetical protein IEU95_05930 [Hoyosella rhizosphaerae]|uniref:Uncharacterized protein n=1 Tax=Hoyosella rhizosphaerae TaxID=1755582 RepID=A0A916U5G4_9ACTN|nr:hypothetical protein [Hoyosella rhizosphaerae]MBN4926361.1 hypothetical protein [Hoyosella rhizosphaerae]GGC59981.1 hypothetical protein GCM10011410_10550 [Hoyosella rhizosphaerae]
MSHDDLGKDSGPHYSARRRLRESQFPDAYTTGDIPPPPAQLDRPLSSVYPLPSGPRYRKHIIVFLLVFAAAFLIPMVLLLI